MRLQSWCAENYARHASFVPELGRLVLEMLDPRPGERILDLGCGDGRLTEEIRACGAEVVGVDASADMVEAARRRGIAAERMDAHALSFERAFDAVFSNAAIHWMKEDPARVVRGVARALRPGGRFVGEFGGHGNIAAIVVALNAVLQRRGVQQQPRSPWYFPSAEAWKELLERHGFEVDQAVLVPRPTPLPTGMAGWLETFGAPCLGRVPEADRAAVMEETLALLRPSLCDESGRWSADYVRLRFHARLGGEQC